jgi:hypothetical protein
MATSGQNSPAKQAFFDDLTAFVKDLADRVCTPDGQWAVKGFIDINRNVYSISSDTKITSKILEIHIFPMLLKFAADHGFNLILAEHQNHYPDMSFVSSSDPSIKFAVDLKTTYRKPDKPYLCKGFTLGSHGEYFRNRTSTKNIRFPYAEYDGHFCLGVIYDRAHAATIDETKMVAVDEISGLASVMSNMQFFVAEKWRLASDRRGSGNTANIGSIELIEDVITGRGMFSNLGEDWFDEFWINYGVLKTVGGQTITKLADFVQFKSGDQSLIVKRRTKV